MNTRLKFAIVITSIAVFLYLLALISILISLNGDAEIKFKAAPYWFSLFFSGTATIIAVVNFVFSELAKSSEIRKSVLDDFWFRKLFGESSIPDVLGTLDNAQAILMKGVSRASVAHFTEVLYSIEEKLEIISLLDKDGAVVARIMDSISKAEDKALELQGASSSIKSEEENIKIIVSSLRNDLLRTVHGFHLELSGINS